ncbi:MAG: hypothetical protein JNK67_21040 [Alphaproteobacteria bacterium]|nr:hypothetical protein [Alphaproteobacteria bacterium]
MRVSPKTLWIFVRVADRDGVAGWGEATLGDPHGHAELAAAIGRLARMPLGARLAAPVDLIADPAAAALARSLPGAAAVSALDQALNDVAARREGVPLAQRLGTPARATVPLYANINRRTLDRAPAGFAASARTAQAAGFAAFKIAPFDGVTPAVAATPEGRRLIEAGLARAAAVRAEIGPHAQLMIDCHWRLTEAAALDVLTAAAGLDLHWLECAVPETPENLPAMRRIREAANRSGVLTAGCETMIGVAGFAPFLDAGVYDVIMPDVKYVGGLQELRRVAEAAAAAGVLCSLHNPSGPVCHAHSIQASAAIGGPARLEHQFDESPLFAGLVDAPPRDFVSPEPSWRMGAGLGIALDAMTIRAHAEAWPSAPAAAS